MDITKYTFWKLINKYSIEIPIIQRDYAQGREDNKATEIRIKILSDIFDAINEGRNLDFDFVYGNIKNTHLIPLDGQQRLTTLFLLHYYLANKDNETNTDVKRILSKFTYETRTSSREFCSELINKGITLPTKKEEKALSNEIKNSAWYFLSWDRDPTIKSMLSMLDAIHEKFYETSNFFKLLINNGKGIVSFQFIPIENFGLTDNLYIKMNARGKALTDFENFKAKFEQFLSNINIEIKNNFSQKIDGRWTDLFWKYKEDDVIDKPFMRYFYFISEMLYFFNILQNDKTSPFEYNGKNPKINFNLIKKVFSETENIIFLFNSLDILYEINDISAFFEIIFSDYDYKKDRVALFDDNINLFQRCIEANNFGLKEKILLFSIIKFCIQLDIKQVDSNLVDFVRIVRNLLLGWRSQEQTKYESNLRVEFLNRHLKDICALINSENIYNTINNFELTGFQKDSVITEKLKAKLINSNYDKLLIHELEDHYLLRGSIHNFDIENNFSNLSSFIKSFREIWSTGEDSLIIRAMLTIDDYSINITSCALGITRLFGNSVNWHTILTKTAGSSDKILNVLPKFLLAYDNSPGTNPVAKLHSLIDMWLQHSRKRNWYYYFIKYPEMTSGEKNYYSWKNDYEIRNLGSYSFNPLSAYHINPYIRTVAKEINNNNICILDHCYGRYGEEASLKLVNKVKLYCKDNGWVIVLPEGFSLNSHIITSFKIESLAEDNTFLLKESDKKDRIEVAIEFSKKLMESESGLKS